jgi:hypothetical protein
MIRFHNGIILFLASKPSSNRIDLGLFESTFLYKGDTPLQLCQVVSILKQCPVLPTQQLANGIRSAEKVGNSCGMDIHMTPYQHMSQ